MEKVGPTSPCVATPINMNRRDHYIPQGYLRGFIDPERRDLPQPLWHFDKINGVWSKRSPKEVGYRYGFYDYTVAEMGVETADMAFAELERTFPKIRKELLRNNFKGWKSHLDFLLRYVQMMRARSLLFFENQQREGRHLKAWVVEEVSADRMTVRVRSMTPESLPEPFIKNWTITNMRSEIAKGAAWLNEFNWALRFCDTTALPFVASELPFMAYGPHSNVADAVRDPESLLFFPLCWQACLVGSRQFFGTETDRFGDEDMRRFARMYRESAQLFVISPRRLDFS
jgi:hypothetical protein